MAKPGARSGRPGRRAQLHRAVSKLGWGSRAQAWSWIEAGKVQVDGQVVTDPLTWVDLDRQAIVCGGKQAGRVQRLTLALHKPPGVVTTRKDERGRPTVYDLLPADRPWIFPAGRLDADSEGLLILTNDRQLAVRLTEPEHRVPKVYRVTIRGLPTEQSLQQLRKGIALADGMTRPVEVKLLEQDARESVVRMVLREGRNRQIRRMWSAVGHRVRRLVRIGIGRYALGNLPSGSWRELDAAAVEKLLQDLGSASSGRG